MMRSNLPLARSRNCSAIAASGSVGVGAAAVVAAAGVAGALAAAGAASEGFASAGLISAGLMSGLEPAGLASAGGLAGAGSPAAPAGVLTAASDLDSPLADGVTFGVAGAAGAAALSGPEAVASAALASTDLVSTGLVSTGLASTSLASVAGLADSPVPAASSGMALAAAVSFGEFCSDAEVADGGTNSACGS